MTRQSKRTGGERKKMQEEIDLNDSPEIIDRKWDQMTALRIQIGSEIK